ncbi:hypothetical protein K2173_007581 [Erythroxylum novogranatense]|uniref:Cytochrome b561 and DOMON domain-containing protein n=1 Tax=Erythroxylum novogranatense TaxID=1862640 RepID=A0AAV8S965_9ROSI|nr:hypothetical protein K2173_007581 [Erythroxylum novogranatense]
MGRTIQILLLSCVLGIFSCVPSLAQDCASYSFSKNQVYTTCASLPVLSSFLHWTLHPSNNTVDVAFRRSGSAASNWIAWGLNPSGQRMAGTQALIAYRFSNGSVRAYTSSITASPTMLQSNLSFEVPSLTAEYTNGDMIIHATLQLNSNLLSTNQVWQEGPVTSDNPGQHAMASANMQAVGSINFQSGATTAGSNSRAKKRNVHGVLNAVSWGILMPLGIIIARYLKVFKSAGPAWFYLHVGCQISAYAIGVAGWGTGLKLGSDSPGVKYDKHRNLGITLFCLATLQVFALLLRPKPENKYRMYWNFYHWSIGYSTIILSIINIYEGFDILNPEKKWKRAYTGVLIFLAAVAAVLEATTWMIVLNRKKTEDSHLKHVNGNNSRQAV